MSLKFYPEVSQIYNDGKAHVAEIFSFEPWKEINFNGKNGQKGYEIDNDHINRQKKED